MPALSKAAWNRDGREKEKGVEESCEALKILEKELKGRFFNGDSVGLVDIAGLYVAYWLPIVEEASGINYWFDGKKFPMLEKWSHEIVNHPTIKLALPPRDNLLAYAKAHNVLAHVEAQLQSIIASSK